MESTKILTKMCKKELYDEVKASREIIKKYTELQSQCDSVKENLEARTLHIQKLQIENKKLLEDKIHLEGELVEFMNHPCSKCSMEAALNPSIPIETQIYADILNLYKDKLNKFDKLQEDNLKYKKILKGIYDNIQEHVKFISDED